MHWVSDNRLSVGYLRMEEWFSRKTDPKERPREVIFGWGREPGLGVKFAEGCSGSVLPLLEKKEVVIRLCNATVMIALLFSCLPDTAVFSTFFYNFYIDFRACSQEVMDTDNREQAE